MVLRDAAGLVVDSLNYGDLVDPWAAQGYQAASGLESFGCYAPSPGSSGGVWTFASSPPPSNISAGRFPDGADTQSNCTDFLVQAATILPAGSAAGASSIKVASVVGFEAGQTIRIDTRANLETAVIASVGTAGVTTVSTAVSAGASAIHVAGVTGFSVGQTITIGSGTQAETGTIASVTRFGPAVITLATPLTLAHSPGAQVSGTGIALTAALTKPHAERSAGHRQPPNSRRTEPVFREPSLMPLRSGISSTPGE